MHIYTTTMDEFRAFERFFAGHTFKLLPKDYSKSLDIDLLLFPGGSDIHPNRYGANIPANSGFGEWLDTERDEWEFSVIRDVSLNKLQPTKVLGVCRGMQFLNVAMGGRLTYDIFSRYGRNHPAVHEIRWQMPTVFSSLTHVNSSHHQCIYTIGDNQRPRILGSEPTLSII